MGDLVLYCRRCGAEISGTTCAGCTPGTQIVAPETSPARVTRDDLAASSSEPDSARARPLGRGLVVGLVATLSVLMIAVSLGVTMRRWPAPSSSAHAVSIEVEPGSKDPPPTGMEPVAARFAHAACGSIHDTKTGLDWFIGPDRNLTFDEAHDWADALDACNASWRLPRQDELAALYDPWSTASAGHVERGKTWPPHLDTAFASIGGGSWVWASDPATDPSAASSFNFNLGKKVSYSANSLRYSTRAFAVRADGRGEHRVPSPTGFDVQAAPISVAEATAFATAYFDEVARNDLDAVMSHFAERVEWYSKGLVTRDVAEREQRKYQQRWPDIRFSLDGTVEARPTRNGSTLVAVPFAFDETDGRGRQVSGKAINYWMLVRTPEGIRIAAEDQKILSDAAKLDASGAPKAASNVRPGISSGADAAGRDAAAVGAELHRDDQLPPPAGPASPLVAVSHASEDKAMPASKTIDVKPGEIPITTEEAANFARAHFDAVNRSDIESEVSDYDETVDWYSEGEISISMVEQAQRAYHRRWPRVHFEVADTPQIMSVIGGATGVSISCAFTEENIQGKRIAGRLMNYWKLRRSAMGLKIFGENQKLTNRSIEN